MNADFLIDFKYIEIKCNRWLEYKVVYKDTPIRIGEYRNSKYIELGKSKIKIESIRDIGGTLLIEVIDNKYYVLKTEISDCLTVTSILKTMQSIEDTGREYINSQLIKCENLYEVVCAIGEIPDDNVIKLIEWDKTLFDGTLITSCQTIANMEYKHRYYILDLAHKWLMIPVNKNIQLMNCRLILDLKDNMYKLVYLKDGSVKTIYETPNKLSISFDCLFESIDENTNCTYRISKKDGSVEVELRKIGNIKVTHNIGGR